MAKGWTAQIGTALALLAGAAAAQPTTVSTPAKPPQAAAAPASAPPAPQEPPPLCAPAKLTRMIVRNISPNLLAAATTAQPRLLYRKGSTQLRSEDSPDPGRNAHNIVVISEPHMWAINMATATGQHSIDPGPELNVHAPILPVGIGVPPTLMGLEFGCEAEFVARYAPQPRQAVAWGADRALVHAVAVDEHVVTILMRERDPAPLMIVYAREGKPVFALRYDEWRTGLSDSPALFEPPKTVTFTEAAAAKPEPAKPTT